MGMAIPGKVVEILAGRPDLARVDVNGVRRSVDIGLIEDENVQPGDWVLIDVGIALSTINEEQARAVLDFLERAGKSPRDGAVRRWRTCDGNHKIHESIGGNICERSGR